MPIASMFNRQQRTYLTGCCTIFNFTKRTTKMRLSKFLFFLICYFSLANSFGQGSQKDVEQLNTFLQGSLSQGWFPDSTHLYVGQVQVLLEPAGNYKPKIISINTTLTNKLSKLDAIKEYNFQPFTIKNKTVRLIIPIGVNSISFKDRNNPVIKADSLHFELSKLFYRSATDKRNEVITYLEPILIQVRHTSGY
jgi:hypothetical protein